VVLGCIRYLNSKQEYFDKFVGRVRKWVVCQTKFSLRNAGWVKSCPKTIEADWPKSCSFLNFINLRELWSGEMEVENSITTLSSIQQNTNICRFKKHYEFLLFLRKSF
jgi:hypothetical protein